MKHPASQSHAAQLDWLESNGLHIPNRQEAEWALTHLGLHRLQLYSHPFRRSDLAGLEEETSIRQILELYEFEQRLGGLTLAAIRLVEVSVRCRLAHVLCQRHGPEGYLYPEVYRQPHKAMTTLRAIGLEASRAGQHPAPPATSAEGPGNMAIWEAVECFTFGTTSKLYGNIADSATRREIAATYGLSDRVLIAALYHLNVARNLVAHHSRFWNVNIREKLLLPKSAPSSLRLSLGDDIGAAGCYNTLVMLCHLVRRIDPRCDLPESTRDHLGLLPEKLRPHAGIPDDWTSRPVWNRR